MTVIGSWPKSRLQMAGVDMLGVLVHANDLDATQPGIIYFVRDSVVTEDDLLSLWSNLEEDRTGVLGLTQLPVPKLHIPSLIELHGEYLCWSDTRYTLERVLSLAKRSRAPVKSTSSGGFTSW